MAHFVGQFLQRQIQVFMTSLLVVHAKPIWSRYANINNHQKWHHLYNIANICSSHISMQFYYLRTRNKRIFSTVYLYIFVKRATYSCECNCTHIFSIYSIYSWRQHLPCVILSHIVSGSHPHGVFACLLDIYMRLIQRSLVAWSSLKN